MIRTMIRRGAVLAAVALAAGLALFSAPASAQDLDVAGRFTASGGFADIEGCETWDFSYDGTGDWTGLGAVALELDFCADNRGPTPFPTIGMFSVTTASGAVAGDVSGMIDPAGSSPDGFPISFTLIVTSGSGELSGASGSLALVGGQGPFGFTAQGSVSGRLTVPDPTPSSKDDCKDGGWRDLADDEGQPFGNQGRCIAWVNAHA